MNKSRDLPVVEKRDVGIQRRRSLRWRLFGLDDVMFFIVIFLIASTIWFMEIRASLPTQKHTCGKPLTIEERAAKILKENPLIGLHISAITKLYPTNLSRWPQ
jgi:membrane dipeptidase